MSRFLTEADYDPHIKAEIKKAVTGTTDPASPSAKQLLAEETAIAHIREYIGGRCDCDDIFSKTGNNRNKFIVKVVVVITLYDLYHQTGAADIPDHRKDDYDDVIQWLKDVGRGDISTTLPPVSSDTSSGDFRFFSRPYIDQDW